MWGAGRNKKFNPYKRHGRTGISSPKVILGRPRRRQEEKNRQGIKLSRKSIENIFLIIILIGILYWIFGSSYFNIEEVMVEGNQTISGEELEKLVTKDQNIFLFKTDQAKLEAQQKFPQIKEIAVFKGLPNAVKIQIVEKKNSIIWQTNNLRYYVDAEGKISRQILSDESVTTPTVADNRNRPIAVGEAIISPEFIYFVNYVSGHFEENTNRTVTNYAIDETSYDLTVTSSEGMRYFFDTTRSPEKQLLDLRKILTTYNDQIKEYVDLRIDGWGYYK